MEIMVAESKFLESALIQHLMDVHQWDDRVGLRFEATVFGSGDVRRVEGAARMNIQIAN